MIKITLGELFTIAKNKSMGRLAQEKLPVPVSFAISKMMKAMNAELEDASKKYNELAKKYSDPDSKGEEPQIKPELIKEAEKDIHALLGIEIELPYNPIKISDIAMASLSPEDAMTLSKFIVDDTEPLPN